MRLTVLALLLLAAAPAFSGEPVVRTMRTPGGGIQPQVAVDRAGGIHMVYFKGDPAHGDLFYVRSSDGGAHFSPPARVNQNDGSAIAVGTIRGAQVAVGKNNRVHVAWNGSNLATPKAPGDAVPMLYARSNDAGDAFEPERNLITRRVGLDGGGSVAADAAGDVYVSWHAPTEKGAGEAGRRVWVAKSTDDGKTFGEETQAFDRPTGACGCCGMKLFADDRGSVFALYRSATEKIHRDIYLLRSDDGAAHFQGSDVAPMTAGVCVMSSAAMTTTPDATYASWESEAQIYWTKLPAKGVTPGDVVPAPGSARGRKHPAIAVNSSGLTLLAWTEGTGWNKGGSVAWQVYDASGKPVAGASGKAQSLPVWGLPAAFADREGRFTIVY